MTALGRLLIVDDDEDIRMPGIAATLGDHTGDELAAVQSALADARATAA